MSCLKCHGSTNDTEPDPPDSIELLSSRERPHDFCCVVVRESHHPDSQETRIGALGLHPHLDTLVDLRLRDLVTSRWVRTLAQTEPPGHSPSWSSNSHPNSARCSRASPEKSVARASIVASVGAGSGPFVASKKGGSMATAVQSASRLEPGLASGVPWRYNRLLRFFGMRYYELA